MTLSSTSTKSSPATMLPARGSSDDSEGGNNKVNPSKVLRKLDLRLLPFVSLLYLLSFLYVISRMSV